MKGNYNKHRSKTFAGIYLKNGKIIYRASLLELDSISIKEGIEQLVKDELLNRFFGQYRYAIIFDNRTKKPIEEYNQNGIMTKHHEY